MLTIIVPGNEYWDEKAMEFITYSDTKITLEHSLLSISKWESKWHKPFMSSVEKSEDEILDYIKCMTITNNLSLDIYDRLSRKNIEDINNYINDPMTATTINNRNQSRSREIVTSELIYYWMVAHNIPFECEKWHINRLLMLINICNIKSQPNKQMKQADIMRNNAELNAARRKALGSKG